MRNPTCNLCPFGKSSPRRPESICLVSDILTQKDVMVIAEQPSRSDDQYGKAFVGRGLKEIRKWLEAEGIDAHYTYAMKCARPDKDTKPKPAHVKICRNEYLEREMKIVKPKHIIVLGSNALLAALGKPRKMTEVQGTRFKDEKTGAWIYTTIHYAQALYSEENKQTMWAELKMYLKWIKDGKKELTEFKPPIYFIRTVKSLRRMARRIQAAGGLSACDIESQGLNPYHPERHVRTIQFTWDPEFGGAVVPLGLEPECYYTDPEGEKLGQVWSKEDWPKVGKILRRILRETKLIWHNGKFDRIWLWCWGKREFGYPLACPYIYMDTMHVAYLLNENRRLKLKRLITSELGIASYDIPDKMALDLDVFIPYSGADTVATYLLARKYCEELQDPDNARIKKFYFNVLRRADALYTKMEIQGWPAHEETAARIVKDLSGRLDNIQEEMREVLEKCGLRLPLDKKTREPDYTVFASPKKLSPLIWNPKDEGGLGLEPHPDPMIAYNDPKNKEGLSTDENALVHVKSHPFVAKLLEWRSISKALQTYARPMLRAARTRGKLTTSYKLAKVVTGRTASGKEDERGGAAAKTAEGMNLQNIPPDRPARPGQPAKIYGIKKIVRCPDSDDEWIMEVDFGQIELRIAAELSRDPMLLWAYENNVDLHTYRAMRTMGLDEEGWEKLSKPQKKEARLNAKPVNFGYLYGMSWYKFRQFALVQYGIDFSADEAKASRELYFHDHSGLEAWYGKQERRAKRLGYIETLSGRRRRLPDMKIDIETASKEARTRYRNAVRQAINSPVQSFGSDLKMMALIEIDMVLDPSEAKLFGEVHDSVMLRVKKHALRKVAEQILPIMRHPRLLDILGIELTVPIEAEAEVGPSWGEKAPIEEWNEDFSGKLEKAA
jgi:uracil-DNA glycosylase family 4